MYFELLSREEFEKIYPDLPRENVMSPEKLFIRDLINLCEQYGMLVDFAGKHPMIYRQNAPRKDEKEMYKNLLDILKELQ